MRSTQGLGKFVLKIMISGVKIGEAKEGGRELHSQNSGFRNNYQNFYKLQVENYQSEKSKPLFEGILFGSNGYLRIMYPYNFGLLLYSLKYCRKLTSFLNRPMWEHLCFGTTCLDRTLYTYILQDNKALHGHLQKDDNSENVCAK